MKEDILYRFRAEDSGSIDGGEPMSGEDNCRSGQLRPDPGEDSGLGVESDRRSCLVEDQNPGPPDYRPGDI